MARSNAFRLKAKNIFLTYPQFDSDIELLDIRDILEHKFYPAKIDKYVIAKELHQDGNTHIHCYVCLSDTFSTRDPNYLDIDGRHGNYQACRSAQAVVKYCTKEDNYISCGVDIKVTWDAIRRADSKSEFLDLVSKHRPRDYILSYDRIISYADAKYPTVNRTPAPIRDIASFSVPQSIQNWFNEYAAWVKGPRDERFKSLIITSPTRFGKTAYVRSICRHLGLNPIFNTGAFNARALVGDYDLIVFDDVEFESVRWGTFKPLFAGQWDVVVTDKYLKKVVLPHGKHIVWLGNDLDWINDLTVRKASYVRDNFVITELWNKLF